MGKYFSFGEPVILVKDSSDPKTLQSYDAHKNQVGIVMECDFEIHSWSHGTLYMATVNFGDSVIRVPADNLESIWSKRVKILEDE